MIGLINSSPFATYKEYADVKGPIYTFANQPGVITFLLVLCVLIFLYFIYASFKIKKGSSTAKNPILMSFLIAMSAVSLGQQLYNQGSKVPGKTAPQQVISRVVDSAKTMPFALLGLVGIGTATGRRRGGRRSNLSVRKGWFRRGR